MRLAWRVRADVVPRIDGIGMGDVLRTVRKEVAGSELTSNDTTHKGQGAVDAKTNRLGVSIVNTEWTTRILKARRWMIDPLVRSGVSRPPANRNADAFKMCFVSRFDPILVTRPHHALMLVAGHVARLMLPRLTHHTNNPNDHRNSLVHHRTTL